MKKQLLLIISLFCFSSIALGSAAQVGHKTAAKAAGPDVKQTAEHAARADAKRELFKAIRPDNDQKLVIPEVLTVEDLQPVADVIRTTLTSILTQDPTSKDVKTYRAMSAQISEAIKAKKIKSVSLAVDTHVMMNNEMCRVITEIFEHQSKNIFLVVPTIPRSVKAADLSNDLLQATYHSSFQMDQSSVQAVQKLAQNKDLINKQNTHFGMTPLMIACYLKDPELFEILMNAGADVSLRDYQGNTAMHYLFMDQCNAAGTLNVVLDVQVYMHIISFNQAFNTLINVQNMHGITPLMMAGLTPFHALPVGKLIEYGADGSITDKWGNKALDLAQHAESSFAYRGWYDKRSIEKQFKNVPQTRAQIIKFLTDAQQIFKQSKEETAALITGFQLLAPAAQTAVQVVESPAVKSIDLYLERLKNINKQMIDFFANDAKAFKENIAQFTEPINELSIALFRDDEAAIAKLSKNKELVNKADPIHKQTPLMIACFLKIPAHVKRLLTWGADPSCTDIAGNTAMHYLLMDHTGSRGIKNVGEENYCTIIGQLHSHNQTLINAKNSMGHTPLMMAALSSLHSKPLTELTRLGANTALTDSLGNTALDLVRNAQNSSKYNDWYRGIASIMNTAAIRKQIADHLSQALQAQTTTAAAQTPSQTALAQEKSAAEIKQKEADALDAAFLAVKAAKEQAKKDKRKKKTYKPQPMKVQPRGKTQKPDSTPATAVQTVAAAPAPIAALNAKPTPAASSFKHDAQKSAFSAPTAATIAAATSKKADVVNDAKKQKKEKTEQAAPTTANQLEEQLALHESYKLEFDDLVNNGTKEQVIELHGKYATLVKRLQELKCPRADFKTIYYKYYVPLATKVKSLK
jgi:ankyrin repeat protein